MSFEIRRYGDADAPQIATLFFDTIHSVNLRDYTSEQIDAWAPPLSGSEQDKRAERFARSLKKRLSYVADQEGIVIDFANIAQNGYADWMYVHKRLPKARGSLSSVNETGRTGP